MWLKHILSNTAVLNTIRHVGMLFLIMQWINKEELLLPSFMCSHATVGVCNCKALWATFFLHKKVQHKKKDLFEQLIGGLFIWITQRHTKAVQTHYSLTQPITYSLFRIVIPADLVPARSLTLSNIRQQVTATKANTPVTVRPATYLCLAKYND